MNSSTPPSVSRTRLRELSELQVWVLLHKKPNHNLAISVLILTIAFHKQISPYRLSRGINTFAEVLKRHNPKKMLYLNERCTLYL